MSHQLTASAVAEMESEIDILRTENQNLRTQLALAEAERDAKKLEVTVLTARVHEELIRATQMDTIMSQVSMGLVAGLEKMKDQRTRARQARQVAQEDGLGVGRDGHSPVFAPNERFASGGLVQPRGADQGAVTLTGDPPMPRRAYADDRQHIERLGPPHPRAPIMDSRTNEPRTNIDDARLPKVELRTDQDELRDLGARMVRTPPPARND